MADKAFHKVIAPLALVKDKVGKIHYLYSESVIPVDMADDERDRLIHRGLIAECDEHGQLVEPKDGKSVTADERTDATDTTPREIVIERPKLTAPEREWVDYAVKRGMARERAESLGKRGISDAYPVTG
jgi:hypothetical protein